MEYVSIKEVLADIRSKFPVLADSGDIDNTSIYTTILRELRKFGVDVLQKRKGFVFIENGRGMLPDNFRKLRQARLIDYKEHNSETYIGHTDNYITRQTIENPAFYDKISGEYIISCDSKIVTETITLDNRKTNVKYNSKFVEVVNGGKVDSLSADCINKRVKSNFKVSVTDLTLNTNFEKGKLFIEYYGLPTNEDEEISIPILSTGALYDYIENQIKIELATFLIQNNLASQGIQTILEIELPKSRILKSEAYSEVNFHGLGNNWSKSLKVNNIRQYNKNNPLSRWR